MTASDHLNEHQWPRMPIDDVLKLPSIDAINEKSMPGHTVADILPAKDSDIELDRWGRKHNTRPGRGYPAAELYDSMAEHGQQTPVHIFTAGQRAYGVRIPARYRGQQMLGNGGHRVAVARQLGWPDIAYTPDKQKSATEEDT